MGAFNNGYLSTMSELTHYNAAGIYHVCILQGS